MKAIKQFVKKRINVFLNNLVNSKINKSIDLLILCDYEAAAKNDENILAVFKFIYSIGSRFKLINLLPKETFLKYVSILDSITLYQRDTGVCNQSVTLFTNDLLNDGITSVIFDEKEKNKYVNSLIMLNMRIARMDSYRKIYSKYISKYNDIEKANILVKLLSSYCGDIDYKNEVIPLLERFDIVIEEQKTKIANCSSNKENKSRRAQLIKYVCDIIEIADSVFYSINNFEEIVNDLMSENSGVCNNQIVRLIKLSLRKDRCIATIRKWRSTIEYENYKETVDVIDSILREIATGEMQELRFKKYENDSYGYLLNVLRSKKVTCDEKYEVLERIEKSYENKLILQNDVLKKLEILNTIFKIRYRKKIQAYWKKFNSAMKRVEYKGTYKGLFFLPSDWNVVNGSFTLPFLLEAKKRGYICLPSNAMLFDVEHEDDEIKELYGNLFYNTYSELVDSNRYRYNWNIEICNKKMECNGMNVYEPIFEAISRWQFSCFYNFENNAWARARTNYFMNVFEKAFYQCELLEKWAVKNEKPVRIISTSPHVQNFAAYRIFCEEKGYKSGVEYICARSGYDDYFSNSCEKSATLAAINMTRNPNTRSPIFGTKEGFEKYYKENRNNLTNIKNEALEWFSYQRSKEYDNENDSDINKRDEVLTIIKEYKEKGKKVYLLIGKLIFDLAVKYTKGCAHDDMSDWATHVVKTINNNPDILLLIKPHPHETRKDITMTDESIVSFKDIIKTEFKENIIYLEGHLFRNIDLSDYVDIVLTWNSTSTLEMAALGKKVIMGDECGYLDYPIGFMRFDDKQSFEDFIIFPEKYKQDEELRDKAVMFLSYIGSDYINIKNKYTEVTSSNYHVFDSDINMNAIDDYCINGDSQLGKMFDSIV